MIFADEGVDPSGLMACETIEAAGSFPWIRYFAEVESTNTAAMQDLTAASLPLPPRLYLADRQTAGRGRHGRTWVADNGTLTFSIVVPKDLREIFPPVPEFQSTAQPRLSVPVSMAVGVAVSRAIDHLAAPFTSRIKWPNDVYCGDGKVAGILIEAAPSPHDVLVIGVGLNVATTLADHQGAFHAPARSLNELTQRYPHRYQWLVEVVEQIMNALVELRDEPQSIIHEQRKRCLLTGQAIRYLVEEQWLHATCDGIDDNGSLLVRDAAGVKRLSSGEVLRVRRNS